MEKQTNEIQTNVVKPSLSCIMGEESYRLITNESEYSLDSKINDIENYMANNHGLNQTELIKDNLYGEAKVLWGNYATALRDTRYTFYLTRKQFNFITDLLLLHLEYDVNTVFLAIELTDMLGVWKESGKFKDDSEVKSYTADATEITYMYHLIAKHTVKGLTKSSYLFAEILRKIGDISKIISYYDTAAKNLSSEIQKWIASFEPEVPAAQDVKPDQPELPQPKNTIKTKTETVDGKVVKSKKDNI